MKNLIFFLIIFFSNQYLAIGQDIFPSYLSQPLIWVHLESYSDDQKVDYVGDKPSERWDFADNIQGLAIFDCLSKDDYDAFPFETNFLELIQPVNISGYFYKTDSNNTIVAAIADKYTPLLRSENKRRLYTGQCVQDEIEMFLRLIDDKGWDIRKVVLVTISSNKQMLMVFNNVAYLVIDNKLENLNQYLQKNEDFYREFLYHFNQ